MNNLNQSPNNTARLAGILYAIVVLTGMFSLAYMPSQLIARDNAAVTFQRIVASQTLFRFSIASSIVCYIAFLLLPLSLYQVLKNIDERFAKLMVIFALMAVPISLFNLQHHYAILPLVNREDYLLIADKQALHGRVMDLLHQYNKGILIAQLFWGLWLLPFGYLVYRSGFLPRILGIFLMLGCGGYLVHVMCSTLLPAYSGSRLSQYIRMPASIGEIGICLWLLIRGVSSAQPGRFTK